MFRKSRMSIILVLLLISLLAACSKKGQNSNEALITPTQKPTEVPSDGNLLDIIDYQLEDKYIMIDDFESYVQEEDLTNTYIRNTNGGDVNMAIEKEKKVEGNQGLSYEYDYKNAGYAGVVKDNPGLNLSEFDGIILWSDMDGSGNSITFQITDAEGLTWECVGYLDSKGGTDLYIPFETFVAPGWDTTPRREFDKMISIERYGIYTNQMGEGLQDKLSFDAIRGADFVDQLNNTKVEITTQVKELITGFPYKITGTAQNVRYITLCFDDAKVNVPVINGTWSYEITEFDRVYQSKDTLLYAEVTYMNGTVIAQSTRQRVTFNVEGDFNIPDENKISSNNLAYHKPVVASTIESDGHKAEYAVDEDLSTRWSSAYEDGHYIIIDLEEEKTFHYILLQWEAAYAKEYQILGSNDNQNWTVLHQEDQSEGGNVLLHLPNTKERYLKMDCITRATEYGNSIYEIGVYVDEPEMPIDEDAVDEMIHTQAKDMVNRM